MAGKSDDSRPLDERIAREVMEWRFHEKTNQWAFMEPQGWNYRYDLPQFSSDMKAAELVVRKIFSVGGQVSEKFKKLCPAFATEGAIDAALNSRRSGPSEICHAALEAMKFLPQDWH